MRGQSNGDGMYLLDPDGGSHSNAFLAYCDMDVIRWRVDHVFTLLMNTPNPRLKSRTMLSCLMELMGTGQAVTTSQ